MRTAMVCHVLLVSLALAATVGCPATPNAPASDGAPSSKDAPAEPRPAVAKAQDVAVDKEGLAQIKARGTLRVIVRRSEASFLPRGSMPWMSDVDNAEAFAESLGVKPVFVLVEAHDGLIDALVQGRGDLIAAPLTITEQRKKQVAFARSTLGVEEIVVGKKGVSGLPKTPDELAGWEVVVRGSSAYASSLHELAQRKIAVKIVEAEEHMDTDAIVEVVTNGTGKQLTVVDSHLLSAFEAYNPDIERLFTLSERREISWAVRKENSELRAALDRFMIERAMTGHKERTFTGDLDAIKKRGVIRVLTRNNAASYFLYRGEERGFDFELAKMIAKELDVRLEMVVAPDRAQLIPWLLAGRGDVIAAQMTVTKTRAKTVAFSEPYLTTKEVLVKKAGTKGPKTAAQLAKKTVHVRPSSSYRTTLDALVAKGIKVVIADAPEDVETATLIHQVAEGVIPFTVADQHLLDIERTYGAEVEAALVLTSDDKSISYGVRPADTALLAFLDDFIKRTYRGLEYNIAKKRYFVNAHTIRKFKNNAVKKTGAISPYDELIKKYAKQYGLDWRLMAAQAYVESGFDPKAKSWVGAEGLFQVMPRTGEAMGFTNLQDPEVGIHAGIKYVARMVKRFDPKIPFKERMRMGLAAYNVGLGHVLDARRLAERDGLDGDKWFGNTEKAMLKLAQREYAKRARHGYCRGREPVQYVSHIQTLYDAYVEVAE